MKHVSLSCTAEIGSTLSKERKKLQNGSLIVTIQRGYTEKESRITNNIFTRKYLQYIMFVTLPRKWSETIIALFTSINKKFKYILPSNCKICRHVRKIYHSSKTQCGLTYTKHQSCFQHLDCSLSFNKRQLVSESI